ncbi:LysR substrate-binding domain-containing protein [Arthrobacter ramosus]|uniref:LysR substrate-binding domain-containing protein n=1 Tax=Arthrobacter ramosus TaxID=1672 RepID=A0ABV5Y5M5_ARTRM|nr:LysR substrate-binding domain-containing protein [Arthrobacter ramosus]
MELRQLRYFVAVAEHLHFGRAAKALNMAQPPLSQQIMRLERALGVQLFERSSRQVELTESGRILLEVSRDVIGQTDHLQHVAEALRLGEAGRVRIGFVASVMNWGLGSRLKAFRARYPNAQVTATQMPVADQVAALQSADIDVGFTMARLNYDDLQVLDIAEVPLKAVLPSDHPLAGSGRVRLSDLASETVISFHRAPDSHVEDFISMACHQAGFIPRLTFVGAQSHTIIHMVGAGFGVSVLPECDEVMGARGVVFAEIEPPVPTIRFSVVRPRRRVAPLVNRLITLVTDPDFESL